MEALKLLQIETTNNCQSKCIFCPHDSFQEFGNMTDELYTRILEEATEIETIEKFIPMGTGEPFCDPKILDRVEQACRLLPETKIVIYTNGGLLTKDILDTLNGMNGHLHIMLSLNALTTETRYKIMGLNDFEHVMDMVHYLDAKTLIPYCLSMVDHPEVPDREKSTFGDAGGWLIRYWSFGSKIYPYTRPEGLECARPQRYMFVRYTGQVSLCCCDVFGEIELGHLGIDSPRSESIQSLKEVWGSAIRQYYAQAHREGQAHMLKMCKNCGGGRKKVSSIKDT